MTAGEPRYHQKVLTDVKPHYLLDKHQKKRERFTDFFTLMKPMAFASGTKFDISSTPDGAVSLNLGLDIIGYVPTEVADWEATKVAYGQKVARWVANVALPGLMSRQGLASHTTPGVWIDQVADTDSTWNVSDEIPAVGRIQQHTESSIVLRAAKRLPVNEVVFGARDQIATAIAGASIDALEAHYGKSPGGKTKNLHWRENGKLMFDRWQDEENV